VSKRFLLSLTLVLAASAFVAGRLTAGRIRAAADARADEVPAATPTSTLELQRAPTPAVAIAAGPDFTRVAGQAVKGVANISSLQVVRTPNSPFANDPFFQYFFGNDEQAFGSRDRRSLSLGSGVIISSDGYVVTNNHVVGEHVRASTEVTVSLPDKREVRAKVIGTDAKTDIALLKINVTGLAVVPWGDSSQLKLGEWVLAIGSPFQLNQTVTAGIISATGRTNLGFADYEDFIQTDAAINPGNSGGALINTRGELVGINTGIFSQSGGYQGIGFAIPSKLARHIVDELMKNGQVRRGEIGYLKVDNLTTQLAEDVRAPNTQGAIIVEMQRNSPTYDAGLRPGDVIVAFNGQPVTDKSQFSRMVGDARIGTTATMKVMREGRPIEIKISVVSSGR
jgi:Do/DeqQ family serine protease